MDIKYIGRNIAKLCVSRGLSQGNLGKEIGLTPSAISNIENAISYPSVDTLIRFTAWFFGHFHEDTEVEDMFYCLYDDIVVLS